MKSSGFTLIELLVVIAIISLVLALSVPSLHRAREETRAVTCQAHIKDLLVAFEMYEATYHSLPYGFAVMRRPAPPGGYLSNPTIDLPGWYWPNFIGAVNFKSLRDRRSLECPAKRLDNPLLQADVLCGNYGVNRSLCRSDGDFGLYQEAFEGEPLSSSAVRNPVSTLLLVDSGYALISWWHVRDDPLMKESARIADTAYVPGLSVNKEREFWQGQAGDAIAGRHPNKKVNVGFLDGHSERQSAEKLLVDKVGEAYPNRSPLWEPDQGWGTTIPTSAN